jgi:hypothetical protein
LTLSPPHAREIGVAGRRILKDDPVSDTLAALLLRNLSEVLLFKTTWPPLESNTEFPHHILKHLFAALAGHGSNDTQSHSPEGSPIVYNGWQQFLTE